MKRENGSETHELLKDPASAKKWRIIERGLIKWGRSYPGAREVVEDLLQRPGKPPIKINWQELGDILD